jgi:dTDP-4-dehydrorhamnose reductase
VFPVVKKIAILGANGLLGRYVWSYFRDSYDVTPVTRAEFDALEYCDRSKLRKILECCDYCINCIGVLKPDIEVTGLADTLFLNSVFPQMLSNTCADTNTKMIHISSDCVFSGKKGNYIETDRCDGDGLYASSKSKEPINAMTVRTSFIGEQPGKVLGLLSWILSHTNSEMQGYVNCVWNGVTCLQLCKTIDQAIRECRLWLGVRHLYSPTPTNKYQLCCDVNAIYDLGNIVHPVEASNIEGTLIPPGTVLDRTLSTVYEPIITPELYQQIVEQREFKLI